MKFPTNIAFVLALGSAVPATALAQEFDSSDAVNRIVVLVRTADIAPLATISKALGHQFLPAGDNHALSRNSFGEGTFYLPSPESTWVKWLWIRPMFGQRHRLSVDVSFSGKPCVPLEVVERQLEHQAKRHPVTVHVLGQPGDGTAGYHKKVEGPPVIAYKSAKNVYANVTFDHALESRNCMSRVSLIIDPAGKD